MFEAAQQLVRSGYGFCASRLRLVPWPLAGSFFAEVWLVGCVFRPRGAVEVVWLCVWQDSGVFFSGQNAGRYGRDSDQVMRET